MSYQLVLTDIKSFGPVLIQRAPIWTLPPMGNCAGKKSTQCDIDRKLDFGGENVCAIIDKGTWDAKISVASENGKIVVANFSASWCEPCKSVAPTFKELSVKYPSLVFVTVDVDDLSELSLLMNIQATPTFFFFQDGQQLAEVVGASKAELLQKVAMLTAPYLCVEAE